MLGELGWVGHKNYKLMGDISALERSQINPTDNLQCRPELVIHLVPIVFYRWGPAEDPSFPFSACPPETPAIQLQNRRVWEKVLVHTAVTTRAKLSSNIPCRFWAIEAKARVQEGDLAR